jgi:tRNA-2-methylthio-N6-dimethylallyladenosine synthase
MPDAAITTDIIVGFPGETDTDFEDTLDVVRQARYASAFTFQYSARPGTHAAELAEQVPKDLVQERFDRLTALVNDIAWQENRRLVGSTVELLVADTSGKKDGETHRLTGRARDNRLVHFVPGDLDVRPGDLVEVEVTHAAPHHMLGDRPPTTFRRTRAGDAWAARQGGTDDRTVGLGMPSVGVPAPLPEAAACC